MSAGKAWKKTHIRWPANPLQSLFRTRSTTHPVQPESSSTSISLHDLHVPVKHLLELPSYPNTESDAANLLRIVHLRREESENQFQVAEKAVLRCTLQLEALQSHPDMQTILSLARKELEAYQSELARATESMVQAEAEVGVVRVYLRRKGFAVPPPSGRTLPPNAILPTDTGDNSDTGSSDSEIT